MTYYDLITLSLSLLGINTVILWLTETSGDTSERDVRHAGTATLVISITQLVRLLITLNCYNDICTFAALSQISYLHFIQVAPPPPPLPPWLCSRISVVFASVIFRSNKSRSRHGVHFTLHLDVTNLPRGS